VARRRPSAAEFGTGLGLAIVRAVVEAHQGKVDVKSDGSHGARFRILLPRHAGGHVSGHVQSPLVAIVEDDAAIAGRGWRSISSLQGYRTQVFADGESAHQGIASDAPDLVLSTSRCPSRAGCGSSNGLREAGNQVPVVVVSARRDEFDRSRPCSSGPTTTSPSPSHLAEASGPGRGCAQARAPPVRTPEAAE